MPKLSTLFATTSHTNDATNLHITHESPSTPAGLGFHLVALMSVRINDQNNRTIPPATPAGLRLKLALKSTKVNHGLGFKRMCRGFSNENQV